MNRAISYAAAALSPLIWWRERDARWRAPQGPEAVAAVSPGGAHLASMMHELRTPLAAIAGLVNLMLEESFGEAQQKSLLTRVASTVAAMDLQIKNAFDLDLQERGRLRPKRRPSRPLQLIEESVARCAAAAQVKQLELDLKAAELPEMSLDPLHLDRIVSNLVLNAIRRTPRGRVAIKAAIAGDALTLHIIDAGGPLAVEHLSRFFSRPENGASNELGCYLARTLAEIDGGSARAANWEEQGVAVTVSLPLAPPGD